MLLLYQGIFGIFLEFWLMWIYLLLFQKVIGLEKDGICSSITIFYENSPSFCVGCYSVGHDVARCRISDRQDSLKKEEGSRGTSKYVYVPKSADKVTQPAEDPLAGAVDSTKKVHDKMNLSEDNSDRVGSIVVPLKGGGGWK